MVLDKPEIATLQNINILKRQPVPEKGQKKVISEHHNEFLLGHPEQDKTIELIQWKYSFPKMREAVEKYIWKCTTCAKYKLARHKPYGEQQQIEAPQQARQEITMDFIIKLLPSKDTVLCLCACGRGKCSNNKDNHIVGGLVVYQGVMQWCCCTTPAYDCKVKVVCQVIVLNSLLKNC